MGTSPDIGLKDARERRAAAGKLLSSGVNPAEHRKAEKAAGVDRAANTFEVVAREWLALKQRERTTSRRDKEHHLLENTHSPGSTSGRRGRRGNPAAADPIVQA